MATADQLAFVRRNAALAADDATYTDEVLGAMIDASGTDDTVASIWEAKAATYTTSVDVTEAGASHKFSDVYKNAMAQAAYWRKKVADTAEEAVGGRVKVRKIERL